MHWYSLFWPLTGATHKKILRMLIVRTMHASQTTGNLFSCMPFGICNPPETFQRTMDVRLLSYINGNCSWYILTTLSRFTNCRRSHQACSHCMFAAANSMGQFKLEEEQVLYKWNELLGRGGTLQSIGTRFSQNGWNMRLKTTSNSNSTEVTLGIRKCRPPHSALCKICCPINAELKNKEPKQAHLSTEVVIALATLQQNLVAAAVLSSPCNKGYLTLDNDTCYNQYWFEPMQDQSDVAKNLLG